MIQNVKAYLDWRQTRSFLGDWIPDANRAAVKECIAIEVARSYEASVMFGIPSGSTVYGTLNKRFTHKFKVMGDISDLPLLDNPMCRCISKEIRESTVKRFKISPDYKLTRI